MRWNATKILDSIGEGGLLLAFWTLGAVVFSQFFFRYFLNISLGWTEELARYLMIAATFLGLPVVTRRGEHIAIEMLSNHLPIPARRLLLVLGEGILIVFVTILVWQAWALAELSSQTMSSIPLPKSIIYFVVLMGLFLQLVASLTRLSELIRNGEVRDANS